MASSQAPNSAVHRFCVKQRGRRVKPEVATVSLVRGVFGGWPACENKDRTRAIKPRGIPQDVDAERERTLISRVHLTRTYNSLYLLLNSFSLRPFVLQIQSISHAFLSFFSRCYTARTFEYIFFLFTNLIIYIKIWHLYDMICTTQRKRSKELLWLLLKFQTLNYVPLCHVHITCTWVFWWRCWSNTIKQQVNLLYLLWQVVCPNWIHEGVKDIQLYRHAAMRLRTWVLGYKLLSA